MASRSTTTRESEAAERLRAYVLAHGVREHPQLAALRAETEPMPMAGMQISPEQGAFMGVLIELLGVRRYLEVGVFTGYSTLVAALAMPEDGRTVSLDVSKEWTDIGRKHWAAAGVAHKIDLRLAPALESLDKLLEDGAAGTFDMAFIDADKRNYPAYYERCLELVRPGGLIALDNMFHFGRMVDPSRANEETKVLDALNRKIKADARVTATLTLIGDGLTLARKR
jgi:predicted O-methyltransferase YrrM